MFASSRSEQLLLTWSANEPTETSPDERAIDQLIVIGAGSLVCNTIGALLYPPLMLLSVPGLTLVTIRWCRTAYMQVVHQRRVTFMLLHAINHTGMLLLGAFWVLSFYTVLAQSSFKVIFKTRDRSRKRLVNILEETPRFVWLERNGTEVQIPFETLQLGDHIIVHAGEHIPVDGTITSGIASIDQHMLTGESQPAEKTVGDSVYAGTIVLSGTLTIQVEHAGSDTVAAQIGAVLNRTADYRSTLELRGEVISNNSVLPMLWLGVVTTLLLGPTSGVTVITCYIGTQMQFTGR